MPSKGDYKSSEWTWITTYTDKKFYLFGDDPEEIDLIDIAHATGMIVRYTGHVREFYSVAEHQVLVSKILEKWGCSIKAQLVGLFHDATEAYLCDIAAPFKGELKGYYELESLIWARIAAKFGLPEKMPPEVKLADWTALFIEAHHLINGDHTQWMGWQDHGMATQQFMKDYPGVKPMCYEPKAAKQLWLGRYEELSV